MTPPFSIEPITPDDVEGLRTAVEAVARERRYLAAVDGFGVDGTRAFVDGLARGGGVQWHHEQHHDRRLRRPQGGAFHLL